MPTAHPRNERIDGYCSTEISYVIISVKFFPWERKYKVTIDIANVKRVKRTNEVGQDQSL